MGRNLTHFLEVREGIFADLSRFSNSIRVFVLHLRDELSEVDRLRRQIVREQLIEIDILDILSLHLHINLLLGYLLEPRLVLVLFRVACPDRGGLPGGISLPLGQILVLSCGGSVSTRLFGSNLSYVLPFGKVLSGDSATDISINLCGELEVSGIGLNHARWLVDLLALLQKLLVLCGAIILHVTVLLQVIHHLLHWQSLAF